MKTINHSTLKLVRLNDTPTDLRPFFTADEFGDNDGQPVMGYLYVYDGKVKAQNDLGWILCLDDGRFYAGDMVGPSFATLDGAEAAFARYTYQESC